MQEWSLSDLDQDSRVPLSRLPDHESIKRLCLEMKRKFTINRDTDEQTTPNDLFRWACRGLGIDPNRYDHDLAIEAVKREHFRIQRLRIAVEENYVDDLDCMTLLQDALRVVTSAERFLLQAGRLFVYASANKDADALSMLPSQMRVESEYKAGQETILEYDATKLDSFQKLFLDLREQLEGMQYRRADSKFFRRVRTVNGDTTLAFEEAMTIEQWVGERCNHDVNFYAWTLSTRPSCNFHNIVRYLSERPLPEAPDLKEHIYLRSFAGDAVGRGSGVYDCDSDMFFPYGCEGRWSAMAEDVQAFRRTLYGPGYKCKAPGSQDTALLHLECSFPFDIYEEVMAVKQRARLCGVWREAYDFEVRGRNQVHAPRLAQTLAAHIEPFATAQPGRVAVTSTWVCIERDDPPPKEYARVDPAPSWVHNVADARGGDVYSTDDAAPEGGDVYVPLPCLAEGTHRFMVPTLTRVPLPRYGLEAEDGVDDPHCWVRDEGSGRLFCVCLGMHWGDIEAREMDQIYETQGFTDYDRFQCYANKGRQFHPVGRRDKHQFAHVMEGIGGCGKSTDLMTQVRFYPSHRQGMFPGNLEPLFGLSAACKEGEAMAMFCSEMSANMACKQEEFNQIISGDVVSAARKNKTPWVGVVRGQLFLVGNKKPANYSDSEGQFTRRLLGIYMPNQVRPRDSRVATRLDKKMGQLCRRNVLAYERFLVLWGSTDPMSQTHLLPPGFQAYYERSLRETNPIKAFLDDSTCPFRREDGMCVLFDDLKECYWKWRTDAGLGRGGNFTESVYHTTFQNYGLAVMHMREVVIDGQTHREVKIIQGLVRDRCDD